MIGHLGARVSALLDGQLPPAEAEEAWSHVYTCHACRDLVEREGWIKRQLASAICGGTDSTPAHLKGALLDLTPGERFALDPRASAAALPGRGGGARRTVAVVGGGAAGAAMLGVLALGLAPASTQTDRRPPATEVSAPVPSATSGQPAPVAVTGSAAASGTASRTPSSTATSGLGRVPAVERW